MSSPLGRISLFVRKVAVYYVNHLINNTRLFVRKHTTFKRVLRPLIPYVLRLQAWTDYRKWVTENATVRPEDEAAIRADIARFSRRPLLSVVMATYETPAPYLLAAIQSVQAQIYDNWELCIADDASSSPHVARILRQVAADDLRIRVTVRPERGHIAAASNSALALAQGEWVVLMDHDDLIPRDTLYEIAAEAIAHPTAQVIYTDEDKIDGQGVQYSPYFKPDFDPDLLLGQNLLNHLTAYRRDLIQSVGGFREGFPGAQDHDLALRATAICGPDAVRHIPRVLYHWRQNTNVRSFSEGAMERCTAAGRRALAEHLQAQGLCAEIHPASELYHRILFPLPDPAPLVSIIIPTRDRADLLRVCLDGVLRRTRYPALEVLIADNGSTEPDALKLLGEVKADPRVRVLSLPGPFNFAHITNSAVSEARGDVLLLLNNDIEVINEDWLREMVSHAVRPDVGAVGARLLYPNGRLQHGGIVLGVGGVAGHLLVGTHRDDYGPFGVLGLLRSVSAVTAACLALRRDVWKQVGGMDEVNLSVAFNDVDLCLKIRKLGLRVVCTPFAELYHHESASRGYDTTSEKFLRFRKETEFMLQKWGDVLLKDPYYNQNFSLENANFKLSFPPRYDRRYKRISSK